MTSIQFVDDPIGARVKQIGKGHAIILLHDFLGPDLCWQGLETYLAEHYKIIFTILPGFLPGESFKQLNPEGHIQFVNSVFAYYELKSAILIGVGMGANLAIQYSNRYPEHVKGLVLIHPSGLNTLPENWKFPLAQYIFQHFIIKNKALFRQYLERRQIIDDSVTDPLPFTHTITKALSCYFKRKYNIYKNLESVKTSILLIWGEKNQFIPVKYAYELEGYLNSVELKVYPNMGYDIIKQNKVQIFDAIHEYIKFRLKKVSHMPL